MSVIHPANCPKCSHTFVQSFHFPNGGGWTECKWTGCGFQIAALTGDPIAKWNEIADLVSSQKRTR